MDVRSAPMLAALPPERVARAEFSTSFRGFDPTEVRSFLARVAGELRAYIDRQAELLDRLGELEKERPTSPVVLDEHRMTELLGAEAARILEVARSGAADIRAAAMRQAEERLARARHEAEQIRAAADTVLTDQTALAEQRSEDILQSAQTEAARLLADATADREKALADAGAEIDRARVDGRRMVAEARQVRERVLTDMARRRNASRQQLDRLKAGRDRLAEAVEVVRRAVEEVTGELNGSITEARIASDRAVRQIDVDAVPTAAELEAEVVQARDAGLIDLDAVELSALRDDPNTGEVPVVTVETVATEGVSVDAVTVEAVSAVLSTVDVIDVIDVEVTTVDVTTVEQDAAANTAELLNAERQQFSSSVDDVFNRLKAPARKPAARRKGATKSDAVDPSDAPVPAAEEVIDPPTASLSSAETRARDAAVSDRLAVHRRDAGLAENSRGLIRALKLVLSDEQNALLELVRQNEAATLDSADLPDITVFASAYAAAAERHLAVLAAVGWASLSGEEGAEPDLAGLPERLGADLAGELRRQVIEALGGDPSSLSERVRGIYREARNRRATALVDHVALSSYTQGQLAAVGAGAVPAGVAMVRWVFESCGPDCLDNSLAGPVALGDPFPTGDLHPPAFPGCRCLLVLDVAD